MQLNLDNNEQVIEITQDTELSCTFVGKGEDSIKTKLTIVHKKPNLKSRINIKAVVYDKARFDLEGILRIDKGASNTDTYLKINCLVLGDHAFARAVPSLEIKEDQVKGGHGATIGYIDPTQMYYLESHGLNKKESEELIVEAFIKE